MAAVSLRSPAKAWSQAPKLGFAVMMAAPFSSRAATTCGVYRYRVNPALDSEAGAYAAEITPVREPAARHQCIQTLAPL